MAQVGKVIQIAGPAVDIQFESGHLPKIYNAIRITSEGFDVPEPINVICEVQQHLGAQSLSIANQAPQIILSLFRGG